MAFLVALPIPGMAQIAGWDTYNNQTYAVKISYPATLLTHAQFSSTYFSTTGWTLGSQAENNSAQHSLFEIQLQDFHGNDKNQEQYYYKSFVRIGLSTAPNDIKNCEQAADAFTIPTPATITLNGKKFSVFTLTDAGMSQYLMATIYRHAEKQMCYSIEYLETGSNNASITQLTALKTASQLLAKKIIATFTFL